MKKYICLLGVLGLLSCGQPTASQSTQTQETAETTAISKVVSPQEFQAQLKETPQAFVLDVRTPEEFEEGHIENAQLINVKEDNFTEKVNQLDKNQPIFLYCRSGKRSAHAHQIMRDLGFTQIYELDGGILAWEESELPIH